MKASYKWLKELVDFNWSPEELAERLTLAGLEVESITPWGFELEKIIVGKIKKVEKHPQAEKLSICLVDIGSELLQVICGAENVKAGMKSPLALIDAKLPSGTTIEKESFKGVESNGMLCSEMELGIGEESEGIMVLEDNLRIGEPLKKALDLEDFILDFDITPNRPDACSMIGLARDIAALSGSKLNKPDYNIEEIEEPASEWVDILLEDSYGCPRYAARVIKDVKITRSPFWLRKKLVCSGVRVINNVVDVSNFVLLETGHPLHAFDYNLFASFSGKPSKRVLVRRAKDKEKFTTLDEIERSLNPEVLLITDGKKPVALAGIMGGLESEVTGKTRNILLESAYFDPRVIRRGRISLGLSTEASYRFERGADPDAVVKSADRAAYLMKEVCGGKVLKGVVDNYPKPLKPAVISFRTERCSAILGIDIKQSKINEIFDKLEIKVTQNKNESFSIDIPSFRPDLTREIDLIEEIARIYGYEKIESNIRMGGGIFTHKSDEERLKDKIKRLLVGKGLFEIITNNLVDPLRMSQINSQAVAVSILNPLNEEHSVLTTSLNYNLLSVISWNLNRKENDLRLFELDKVYREKDDKTTEEKFQLVIGLCGRKTPVFWGEKVKKVDYYDLKGIVEDLLSELKIKEYEFTLKDMEIFTEGMSAELKVKGKQLGYLGKVSEKTLKLFDIDDDVFLCGIDFQTLCEHTPLTSLYTALPRFPRVERDISLIVDEGVLSKDIEKKILEIGSELVEKVYLFDFYKGHQIPSGKKSLAYTIWYHSEEKTLKEEEVESVHKKILEGLKTGFGAEQRQ